MTGGLSPDVLPLLLAALPAISRMIALPENFHAWVLSAAVPASGVALLLGIQRHHAWQPLAAGCLGLALLAAGALLLLGGPFETLVTLGGGLCLVTAHIINWRLRHPRHS